MQCFLKKDLVPSKFDCKTSWYTDRHWFSEIFENFSKKNPNFFNQKKGLIKNRRKLEQKVHQEICTYLFILLGARTLWTKKIYKKNFYKKNTFFFFPKKPTHLLSNQLPAFTPRARGDAISKFWKFLKSWLLTIRVAANILSRKFPKIIFFLTKIYSKIYSIILLADFTYW